MQAETEDIFEHTHQAGWGDDGERRIAYDAEVKGNRREDEDEAYERELDAMIREEAEKV